MSRLAQWYSLHLLHLPGCAGAKSSQVLPSHRLPYQEGSLIRSRKATRRLRFRHPKPTACPSMAPRARRKSKIRRFWTTFHRCRPHLSHLLTTQHTGPTSHPPRWAIQATGPRLRTLTSVPYPTPPQRALTTHSRRPLQTACTVAHCRRRVATFPSFTTWARSRLRVRQACFCTRCRHRSPFRRD
ncbi:hypothetical protein BCR44DRAFT_1033214 [Catenaria anguillulae PL171]|uniref:Secreted protein n=1 Tax=Catenaria anguillulae PL171 TaxID=765915 RepID=A0A1Y2HUR4_9FUNG|nr:hypothetical protein BCR44DRAFT_1033214 [Catenaria anguillulae PL171]